MAEKNYAVRPKNIRKRKMKERL